MNNPSHLPLLALIGGATAIAFAPIFVRVSEVGPLATAFWSGSLSGAGGFSGNGLKKSF